MSFDGGQDPSPSQVSVSERKLAYSWAEVSMLTDRTKKQSQNTSKVNPESWRLSFTYLIPSGV